METWRPMWGTKIIPDQTRREDLRQCWGGRQGRWKAFLILGSSGLPQVCVCVCLHVYVCKRACVCSSNMSKNSIGHRLRLLSLKAKSGKQRENTESPAAIWRSCCTYYLTISNQIKVNEFIIGLNFTRTMSYTDVTLLSVLDKWHYNHKTVT